MERDGVAMGRKVYPALSWGLKITILAILRNEIRAWLQQIGGYWKLLAIAQAEQPHIRLNNNVHLI